MSHTHVNTLPPADPKAVKLGETQDGEAILKPLRSVTVCSRPAAPGASFLESTTGLESAPQVVVIAAMRQ